MAVDLITQSIGIFKAGENMEANQFHAVRFNLFERWQLSGTNIGQGIVVNAPKSGGVANVVVFGVSKAILGDTVIAGRYLTSDTNSQLIEGDGTTLAMESGDAGDIVSVFVNSPSAASNATSGSGAFPWHILETETFTIPDRKQEAIHGILDNEGTIILEGSAQLVIEN